MSPTIALIVITFAAAFVNGALGYGFSSITVPLALFFLPNKLLNPTLVLTEVVINLYALLINREGVRAVWRQILPIAIGLIPGIVIGSYVVVWLSAAWLKVATYIFLLPFVLFQAGRRHRTSQLRTGPALFSGTGLGFLYSTTTISGPPMSLLLGNQGLLNEQFRGTLAMLRSSESCLTAIMYQHFGLFTTPTLKFTLSVLPFVLIGLTAGSRATDFVAPNVFARICRTFDVWIIGFGLSRALIDVHVLNTFVRYAPLCIGVIADLYLHHLFAQRDTTIAANKMRSTAKGH